MCGDVFKTERLSQFVTFVLKNCHTIYNGYRTQMYWWVLLTGSGANQHYVIPHVNSMNYGKGGFKQFQTVAGAIERFCLKDKEV